jgi:Arc/MetJ family transcription regulator
MKRTTICIDEHLLLMAVKSSGSRSKKEAIEKGLRLLVQERTRQAFRKDLGTFDLELTLGELEQLRGDD